MEERVPLPGFRYELCTGCGQCVAVCPRQVLALDGERPHLLLNSDCTYCGACEEGCPTEAVYLSYEIVFGAT